MNNLNRIILIIVAAVVFGALMGIRGAMPFGWQRAIIAAVAFGGRGSISIFAICIESRSLSSTMLLH
jgi:hypothetical protein